MREFDAAAADLLRDLAPRVLGAVLRRCGDFESAEDAVQEALLAALTQWPGSGVPDNPGGWLYHAAVRGLVDRRRSEAARARREARAEPPTLASPPEPDELLLAGDDDTLALMFMCCHHVLSRASAVALTLRAVGGLTTGAIARAFLVGETTMGQRISRAKATLRDAGVVLTLPPLHEQERRLASVLDVLYLVFQEGHTRSDGDTLIDADLAREAIRVMRTLHGFRPDHAEAAGLLALMLLTDARAAARTGPHGGLIPLDEQDRTCWDHARIAEGSALVAAALASGQVGPFQLQAAIAALHGEAASLEATDWPQIRALYALLLRLTDNPMVALNHAVATAMVQGPVAGLREVEAIARDARIAGHYRVAAVRAHLQERAGDLAAARESYREAANGTRNAAERDYLATKAARTMPP